MPLPPFKPKIHVPKSSLRARGEKKNLSSLHIMSQQWPALIRWVWPQKTIPDPVVVLPVPCLSFPSISEKKSLGRGPFLLDTPQRKVPAPSLSSGQRADSEKQGEPKKSCSMDSTVRNPPRNRRFFFFFFSSRSSKPLKDGLRRGSRKPPSSETQANDQTGQYGGRTASFLINSGSTFGGL